MPAHEIPVPSLHQGHDQASALPCDFCTVALWKNAIWTGWGLHVKARKKKFQKREEEGISDIDSVMFLCMRGGAGG